MPDGKIEEVLSWNYEVAPFDWEKRYDYSAWRVTTPEQARTFAVALAETGLPAQYRSDEANGTYIFWWDRLLNGRENDIVAAAMKLAVSK